MIVNQIYLSNRPIGIVRGSPEEYYEYLKNSKSVRKLHSFNIYITRSDVSLALMDSAYGAL